MYPSGTALADLQKKAKRKGPNFPVTQIKPSRLVDSIRDTNMTQVVGRSIPIEVAFCAVLKDMKDRYGGLLWFMCDNVTRVGDTHKGPFSTQNFVLWLSKNNLADTTTSKKSARRLEGYCVILKPKLCNVRIKAGCELYTQFRRRVRRPGSSLWGGIL
jgi:hypothetical protein